MKVEIIKCLEDNFSYILINEANRNCCVVDPGEADPIIKYIEGNNIELKYILNTCLLYTSPSPRDGLLSRMPSSA